MAALDEGLVGVDEDDATFEGLLEDFDELAGEGDFRDEEDGGFLRFEGVFGHFEVDIGFTATGNASKQTSGSWGFLEALEGISLGFIERNWRNFGIWGGFRTGLFEGVVLNGFGGEAGGDHEVGASGKGGEIVF